MDLTTQSRTVTCPEMVVSINNEIVGTVDELEFSHGDCKYNFKEVRNGVE